MQVNRDVKIQEFFFITYYSYIFIFNNLLNIESSYRNQYCNVFHILIIYKERALGNRNHLILLKFLI